jgi:uncharacterized protein YcbK (DUF882 family)
LRPFHRRPALLRNACLIAATSIAALMSSIIVPSSTETAVANGDTRTLYFYHSHTGESIEATFRVNGSYDSAVLAKLNYFLRDWRNNDVTRMDPRLFDVIWEVYRTAGVTTQPIVIVSAYRSPQTNAMLRRRSHGVAEHSQHMLGRAMDTTMPGMPMEKIREIGMRLQRGGVGWYPSSNFVHLDVGGIRAWPRMSYDQLARLFPDGKTVHLAADGRALPRYAEARAEIAARGGVMSDVAQAGPAPFSGLFSWLFGKHDEDEEADARQEASRPGHGRQGNIEVAGLRTKDVSNAGSTPETQSVPASSTNTVSTAASPAPGKNFSPTAAGTDRARLADLGATPGLRLGSDENGQRSNERAAVGAPETTVKEKIDRRAGPATTAPVPPLRPAGLGDNVAIATADVPMPPVRPDDHAVVIADVPSPPARHAEFTRLAKIEADKTEAKGSNEALDAIHDATDATSKDGALARAASLPVLITQGPEDHASVPKAVLAFSSETPVQDSREIAPSKTPSDTMSMPVTQPSPAPVRPDRAKVRSIGTTVSAAFPAQSLFGQSLTGLRRAARIIPDLLSNRTSADYVSSFGTTASDLDTAHFSGAAAKPLALAQGYVHITDSSAAREN